MEFLVFQGKTVSQDFQGSRATADFLDKMVPQESADFQGSQESQARQEFQDFREKAARQGFQDFQDKTDSPDLADFQDIQATQGLTVQRRAVSRVTQAIADFQDFQGKMAPRALAGTQVFRAKTAPAERQDFRVLAEFRAIADSRGSQDFLARHPRRSRLQRQRRQRFIRRS